MVSAKRAARGDGETLQLWTQLWALAYGLDTRSRYMAATIGVTAVERLLIRYLGKHPRSTPRMAAGALGMHARVLGRIIRQLEARHYIARRRHPDDRRRMVIVLTARGLRIDRERRGTVEAAVRRTFGRLDRRTIARSAELLGMLAGELRLE